MSVKRILASFAGVLVLLGGVSLVNASDDKHKKKAGEHKAAEVHDKSHIMRQSWSFGGLTGKYDKEQLRRGFTIYNETCSSCHSMTLLSYRNLTEVGGPEFSKDEVKAIIADKEVFAEPNDEGETRNEKGEPFMRTPLLTDYFVSPYENEKVALARNDGALPPDLSVMAKARGIPHGSSHIAASNIVMAAYEGVKEYLGWLYGMVRDISTQYQEAGPDYIYALLISYAEETPEGKDVGDRAYNHVFPGNAISMQPPLGTLVYGPKISKEDQESNAELRANAKDVSAFLMWAAEPHLNARKSLGLKVLIYLLTLSLLMYFVKRSIWAGVKH